MQLVDCPAVGMFLRNFVEILAFAFTALVFGRVLLSWVDTSPNSQMSAFVVRATEPILAPIRRLLPQNGVVDFSPMIVIVLMTLVLQAFR